MLEPPSEALQKLLFEQRLCRPRDLRPCRRIVQRLARDLPAFDSVWLDALVQLGRLTRFQARLLESPQRDRIGVGPCVLVDRLGGGAWGDTYLARPKVGTGKCVVKLLRASERISTAVFERLQHLVKTLQGFEQSSVAAPHACDRIGDQVVLVSRAVEGPHLGELLVRRGRYPAEIVEEIGRQLIEGLSVLELRRVSHGDIRLANTRLTKEGLAVLVDTGVRTAIDPDVTVHSGLAPERYDGMAPELIGSSRAPDVRSDLYALGCLLWQLLAGRPPYPGGDPLGKLAAHQTRTVDDVRKWAPDTPARLAEMLKRCTARDPAQRPASFRELLAIWGSPTRAGRRRLAAFRRRFDDPAPPTPEMSRAGSRGHGLRKAVVATLVVFACVAAGMLSDRGLRTQFLTRVHRLRERITCEPLPNSETVTSPIPGVETPERAVRSRTGRPGEIQLTSARTSSPSEIPRGKPLPATDDRGTILLTDAGPYEPGEITAVGGLTIRGAVGKRPVILIRDQPLRVWAESLRLENVHVRFQLSDSVAGSPPALVLVNAQSLDVQTCSFIADAVPSTRRPKGDDTAKGKNSTADAAAPTLLAWKLLDLRDPRGGMANVRNVILSGSGPAVHLASPIRQLSCENCLKTGRGPLLQIVTAAADHDVQVSMSGVTLRQSGSLARWRIPANWSPRHKLHLEATDCVFDLAAGADPLIELHGEGLRSDWPQLVQVTGEGSLGGSQLSLAAWVDDRSGVATPLDPSQLDVAGILSGSFRFAGSSISKPADAAVVDYDAPRRSSNPPGIKAATLPVLE